MIMMDQYNKETSQIHAPADLIRRTKEAVREEEQLIAGEQMQQKTVVQPKRSYGKVYKWALPVAAAAVCLILFNVGVMRLGNGMGKSQSGASMDMGTGAAESNDMGLQFAASEVYDETAVTTEQEPIGKDTSSYDYDMTEEEAEEEVYESESYDGGQPSGAVYENTDNGYTNSIDGDTLWIETVDEAPTFYDEPDTECFTIHGIQIYVAQNLDDTWIAYARKSRQRYVISGEATQETVSREEFAEEAYELLMETISSAE